MARERGEAAVEQLEQQVGLQVRAIRRARKLTQQQAATRANVSVGAVKNLESGAGSNLSTMVRVLRALDADEWLNTLPVPRPVFNPLDLPVPRPVFNPLDLPGPDLGPGSGRQHGRGATSPTARGDAR